MLDILLTPWAKAVFLTAVLAILLALGAYVVKKLRDEITGDRDEAAGLLSNFREMQQRGDISEAEYRTIKTAMRGRILGETKGDGDAS